MNDEAGAPTQCSLMCYGDRTGSKEKTLPLSGVLRRTSSERLPGLAAELVRLNVDVIVATGTLAPLAAKQATTTIPIVMANAGDPLGSGLVASLSRPWRQYHGDEPHGPRPGRKRLAMLKEILPGLSRVAVLWNADNPYSALSSRKRRRPARH